MEQNNYTNMFLKTLGDQLNRAKEVIQNQEHIRTTFIKKNDQPLFKSFKLSKKFQENPIPNQDLIKWIREMLKALNENLIVLDTS